MKRALIVILVLPVIGLNGCAGIQNLWTKTTTSWSGDNLRVVLFSGGQAVREYHIDGTVNEDSESTWYFTCNSHLVKVDGDVLVEPRAINPENFVEDSQVTTCNYS